MKEVERKLEGVYKKGGRDGEGKDRERERERERERHTHTHTHTHKTNEGMSGDG